MKLAPILLVVLNGLFFLKAEAVVLDWTGIYRVEGNYIVSGSKKSYAKHHLVLKPKISTGAGFKIGARFDVFNSRDSKYANSQIGQFFGSGIGSEDAASANNANALSNRQKSENVEVSELYLKYFHDHAVLTAGRFSFPFGLGLLHNAGEGPFDNWLSTKDGVICKVILGNFFVMPLLAKVNEKDLSQSDDMTEYGVQALYENPETGLEMGVLYQNRRAGGSGNDAPKGTKPGEAFGGTVSPDDHQELNTHTTNFYVVKDTEQFRFGVEVSIQSGETGVKAATGGNTSISSFGLAAELEYPPKGSKFQYELKAGIASGDDPGTDNKYEGFWFHKNYQVASIMFEHPLGQEDVLRTNLAGSGAGTTDSTNSAATETISNVIYIAPSLRYLWTKEWEATARLVSGYLYQDPFLNADVGKSLGYEVDVGLSYSSKEDILWLMEVGLLFPGEAFKRGEGAFGSKFGYGLLTKAAISF